MYYRNKNGDKIDGNNIKENFTIENTVVVTVIKVLLYIVFVLSFIIALTSEEGATRALSIIFMFASVVSLTYVYLISNRQVDKVDIVN